MQQAVLVDPEREAAHLVRLGDDDALGAVVGDRELRLDRVGAAVDARDHPGSDVLNVAVERLGRDRRHRRQVPEEDRERGQQRQHVVLLGLLPEELLELGELLRVLRGEVLRLAEVVGQVVQLPGVLLRVVGSRGEPRHRRRRKVPRDAVELAGGPPAVLVDRPVAEDLEVLHGVALLGVRVLEGVEEARPLHRLLGGPVHDRGLGDTGRFEDRRPDVDDVGELGAQPAGVLDPLRPGDHRAVARAAEVGGALLAPLERRVPRPRPGGRVVRRVRVGAPGVEPAVLLDQRELLLGGQDEPVVHRQLVEGAGQRSLHARAVVPEDVDDERVVELAQLLDRVEQAADVPVGVLLEAGIDLHLTRVQLLLCVRERVPGGERVRSRRELRVRRDHAQRLLPFEGLLAEHVPALVELAAVLLAPLDRDLVRRVRAPGRVVDEPRLLLVLRAHLRAASAPPDR